MIPKSHLTVIFCIFFIAGIFLGTNFFFIPQWLIIFFLVMSILSFLANSRFTYPYLIILSLILGALRINYCINQQSQNNIYPLSENISHFEGVVVSPPETKNNKQQINLEKINIDGQNYNGRIKVFTNPFPVYKFGQTLKIDGNATKPENFSDDFSYTGWLAKDQIYLISYYPQISIVGQNNNWSALLYKIRENIISRTKYLFPPQTAGLLTGLIVGDKNTLPKNTYEQFRLAGLTHIIVVSGFNLTIFASIFIKSLRGKLNRKLSLLVTILLMVSFTLLTGAESSITRAMIMTIIMVSAPFLSRKNNPTIAILLAATIMIYLNPLILWYDAGFHLSFLATIGLGLFSPPINSLLKNIPIPATIKNTLTETTAAQITTTPYIMNSFRQLILTTPFSNLIVLPLIPITMFAGAITILISYILPRFLSSIISFPVYVLLKTIIFIAEFFSRFPAYDVKFMNDKIYLVFYIVIVLAAYFLNKKYADSKYQKPNLH